MLLNHGADPNIYDDWYDNPLHLAAMKGNLEMMRMLFNRGALAPTKLKRRTFNRASYVRLQDPVTEKVTELLQAHGGTFEGEDEPDLEERDQVSASIFRGLASVTGGYGRNYLGNPERIPTPELISTPELIPTPAQDEVGTMYDDFASLKF